MDNFVAQFSRSHSGDWAKILGDEVGFSDLIKGSLQDGDIDPDDVPSVIQQAVAEAGLQALQNAEAEAKEIALKNVATTDADMIDMQVGSDPEIVVTDPLFPGEKPRITRI
jgi:hypothetical protein